MARSRHRLTKAITLKTIKPTLAWAQGAAYAFDFPANAARFTDRPAGNLLTSPEDFSAAAWVKSRSSITANAVAAPDGTLTADKLVEDATASATHRTYQIVTKASSSPLQFTFSVYLKAAERTFATIRLMDNTEADGCSVDVDLSTGAISSPAGIGGNAFTGLSATTTTLADSWFRFTLTGTTDSDSQVTAWVFLATALGTRTYTGDGASGIYVWGARLEAGSVASDYLTREARYYALASVPGWTFSRASAGYALNNAGQLVAFASGAPRITDRGFLVEGSRQNLCLQSQTFDNASWNDATPNVPTVTANSTVAPDGTLTADTLTALTTNSISRQSLTTTASTTYSFSLYIKQGTSTQSRLIFRDVTNGVNVCNTNVIWTAGVPSASGATGTWTFTQFADGWWRVETTGSTGVGGVTASFSIYPDNSAGTGTLIVWGAQLEAASFPSSYIPTTTAAVTRAADSLTITGVTGLDYPVSVFGELALADADSAALPNARTLVEISPGSNNDRVLIYNLSSVWGATTVSGGVSVATLSIAGALSAGQVFKTAYRSALDNMRAARDGTLSSLDTSGVQPAAPTTLYVGRTNGGSVAHAYIRRLAIFARALTDAELGAITL